MQNRQQTSSHRDAVVRTRWLRSESPDGNSFPRELLPNTNSAQREHAPQPPLLLRSDPEDAWEHAKDEFLTLLDFFSCHCKPFWGARRIVAALIVMAAMQGGTLDRLWRLHVLESGGIFILFIFVLLWLVEANTARPCDACRRILRRRIGITCANDEPCS
ncbi:transmembrane protein, putative [Bodo saltans]|uniref:Transmembrane protein, putative n=1 Tax=Bodo saltans TaxID=75058 RepID=A0A0S4J0K9_BODSA|nr:transmembrane protein, putative [Bodo saltans]|eukprot:CUG06453.1 transmembrane protein, putative [Bodo saltans]